MSFLDGLRRTFFTAVFICIPPVHVRYKPDTRPFKGPWAPLDKGVWSQRGWSMSDLVRDVKEILPIGFRRSPRPCAPGLPACVSRVLAAQRHALWNVRRRPRETSWPRAHGNRTVIAYRQQEQNVSRKRDIATVIGDSEHFPPLAAKHLRRRKRGRECRIMFTSASRHRTSPPEQPIEQATGRSEVYVP